MIIASLRYESTPGNDFRRPGRLLVFLIRLVAPRSRDRGRNGLYRSSSGQLLNADDLRRPPPPKRRFNASRFVKQFVRSFSIAARPSCACWMCSASSGSGGATRISSKSLVISSMDLSRSSNHSSDRGSILLSDGSRDRATAWSLGIPWPFVPLPASWSSQSKARRSANSLASCALLALQKALPSSISNPKRFLQTGCSMGCEYSF